MIKRLTKVYNTYKLPSRYYGNATRSVDQTIQFNIVASTWYWLDANTQVCWRFVRFTWQRANNHRKVHFNFLSLLLFFFYAITTLLYIQNVELLTIDSLYFSLTHITGPQAAALCLSPTSHLNVTCTYFHFYLRWLFNFFVKYIQFIVFQCNLNNVSYLLFTSHRLTSLPTTQLPKTEMTHVSDRNHFHIACNHRGNIQHALLVRLEVINKGMWTSKVKLFRHTPVNLSTFQSCV